MKSGVYLYAVISFQSGAEKRLEEKGLKSESYEGLILVYKEIDVSKMETEVNLASSNLTAIKKLLKSHEEVINGLAQFGTVIPFRFGTVLKDREGIAKLLEEKHLFFKKILDKIRDKEEWGVRLYIDNPTLHRYLMKDVSLNKNMSGTNYLLKIKEERDVENKALEKIEEITKDVIRGAKEYAVENSQGNLDRQSLDKKELSFSSSFLIKRQDREKFKNKIISLQEKYQKMGVALELSGPWQPYSFV